MSNAPEVIVRITAYLTGGGLFNPELAIHDAVRDLLIDARDALMESPLKSGSDYEALLHAAQHMVPFLTSKAPIDYIADGEAWNRRAQFISLVNDGIRALRNAGRDVHKPGGEKVVAFGAQHCGDPLCDLCCPDDLIVPPSEEC